MNTFDSFHTVLNKRPRGNHLPSLILHVKPFDLPLISATTSCPSHLISLRSDRPIIIGRNILFCDYVFKDRRVSKRHCLIFFDNLSRKIFISRGGGGSCSLATASGCFINGDSRSALDQLYNKNETGVQVQVEKNTGKLEEPSSRFKNSSNEIFVNRIRIPIGNVAELFTGDNVLFVCCKNGGHCNLGIRIGFVIKNIDVLREEIIKLNDHVSLPEKPQSVEEISLSARQYKRKPSDYDAQISRGNFLLSQCRHILQSDEPIRYLRQFISDDVLEERRACTSSGRDNQLSSCMPNDIPTLSMAGDGEVKNKSPVSLQGLLPCENSCTNQNSESSMLEMVELSSMVLHREKISASVVNGDSSHTNGDTLCQIEKPGVQLEISLASDGSKSIPINFMSKEKTTVTDDILKNTGRSKYILPPGKNFFLNRLKSVESMIQRPVISLCELLHPVESLSGIFIATFTSDILWFISSCKIPSNLPVTIACHNTERCWSSSPDKRSSVPYSDFPNLVVVNPSFPETIAFGNDRKKQGIACHHPKLLVLVREEHIRVVITSANLVETQWNSITNTIWWQDFPRESSPDYLSLFTFLSCGQMDQELGSDFAAQLAGFMATLLIDVPSQAQWILELAKYNFKGAVGHLVVSIPGIHCYRTPRISEYMQCIHAKMRRSRSYAVNFLGSVEASAVGSNHLFHSSADLSGGRLRKLARFLGTCCQNAYGMSEVILRRSTHITVDLNAVSVLVRNPDELLEGDCIQLGFLPKNVAKWLSPLWDDGFFCFSGHICPKEALSAILGGDYKKVQLTLYVSQGPKFSEMSNMMQPKHVSALCSLIASLQRYVGLWRLEEVLGRYNWPESLETDFFYGASSIGSAVNAQFMASFSAAVGKRSYQNSDSQESDPEWGCWNTSQESRNPSIKILFPTIERVQNASCGILPSKRILCFAERTWQRLCTLSILHDAIPHPHERIGHPMHVKVAQRRFRSKRDTTSFGWVYCGSHNFSAAAWGRPMLMSSATKDNENRTNNSSKQLKLHVCNYELGIIFVYPPPNVKVRDNKESRNIDDIVLPFVVPAPKYGPRDKPATKLAMRDAFVKQNQQERENSTEAEGNEELIEEEEEIVIDEVVEAAECVSQEEQEEKAYAEKLWSQIV